MSTIDWNIRLHNAKMTAEEGEEGDVGFLQVSKRPLTSLFLTTGTKIDPSTSTKRHVHLRFVSQHVGYPCHIKSNEENDTIGYQSFKNATKLCLIESIKKKYEDISIEEYRCIFEQVCQAIDKSIVDYHGVKCYRDGDWTNKKKANIYFLHVCDVLNCISKKRFHHTLPEIIVPTPTLKELPMLGVVSDLELVHLCNHLLDFVILHVDYLYTCYGYYGNHSFMAIRTSIAKGCKIFTKSCFFMNDDHFVNHQIGKLKEFNQNESRLESKLMYRSI